jgi:hypothetical protein
MGVKISVDGRAFDKGLISSLSSKNNATQVLNALHVGSKPLKKEFEELKKKMIKDFLSHPVTKEIMAGPGAFNTSGTLKGYGNLFSFIGFSKGDKPIDPIIKLFGQTTLNVSRITSRGRLKVTVTIPSRDDIFGVTPMPWATGLSWAQRIEQGMPGFGEYLNKSSVSSRSSQGVQTKSNIRAGGFSNVPYVSSFLKKWQDIFLKIAK